MTNHAENVFNKVMRKAEVKFDSIMDNVGIKVLFFEFDPNESLYIEYRFEKNGGLQDYYNQMLLNGFHKVRNHTALGNVLTNKSDIERYIEKNNLLELWNDRVVHESAETINDQIINTANKVIQYAKDITEDEIIEYEENDENGEDSFGLQEYAVIDLLNELYPEVKSPYDYEWTVEEFIDYWMINTAKKNKHK